MDTLIRQILINLRRQGVYRNFLLYSSRMSMGTQLLYEWILINTYIIKIDIKLIKNSINLQLNLNYW